MGRRTAHVADAAAARRARVRDRVPIAANRRVASPARKPAVGLTDVCAHLQVARLTDVVALLVGDGAALGRRVRQEEILRAVLGHLRSSKEGYE